MDKKSVKTLFHVFGKLLCHWLELKGQIYQPIAFVIAILPDLFGQNRETLQRVKPRSLVAPVSKTTEQRFKCM